MEFIIKKAMYLTQSEINQLQKDLMSSNKSLARTAPISTSDNSSDRISDLVIKEVEKEINDDIGLLFEENIRKTLEIEYNWKLSYIPRKFFYRDIKFKGKIYLLSPFCQIEAKSFWLCINPENNVCQFINKSNKQVKKEIGDNENVQNITFENRIFTIGPPKEVSFAGLFANFDFEKLPFDKEEVEILFDNTNFNDYNFAVIEIKLNAFKIKELIDQLKEDRNIMSKIIENNAIYLGFINITRKDYQFVKNINFSEYCGDCNCILFGIKNGIFCKRNITYPVDWKLVSQFYSFKKEIKEEIENTKKELKELINEVFKELKNFEGKVLSKMNLEK